MDKDAVMKQYWQLREEINLKRGELAANVNNFFDPFSLDFEEEVKKIKELINEIEKSSIKFGMICNYLDDDKFRL